MSSVEFLRPTIYSKFHASSNSKLLYLHGLSFFHNHSRVFHYNVNRFCCNSSSFPVTRPCKNLIKISRNHERFDLWASFLKKHRVRESRIVACSQDGDSKAGSSEKSGTEGNQNPSSSGSKQRREKRGKGGLWWSKGNKWQWQPIIQAQEMGVLLLQLGIVMFVMRLLRPGIPLPGSEPRTQTTFVSVPYSEFLSKINSNQVHKVEVDGVHIMFKLKNEGSGQESEVSGASRFQESESLLRSVAPTKRVVYTTTRPTDIKTPYEKMLENEVEFGSPDKRSGGFFNSALVSYRCSSYLGT